MSHIVVEKGGIFWEGGVDSGSPIHIYMITIKGGRSWEGGVDSGSHHNLPRGFGSGSIPA